MFDRVPVHRHVNRESDSNRFTLERMVHLSTASCMHSSDTKRSRSFSMRFLPLILFKVGGYAP